MVAFWNESNGPADASFEIKTRYIENTSTIQQGLEVRISGGRVFEKALVKNTQSASREERKSEAVFKKPLRCISSSINVGHFSVN